LGNRLGNSQLEYRDQIPCFALERRL